jgi:hypothetical protein
MGTYTQTFPTDGNNIPGEGVFDQTGQISVLKEGYGPVTAGTNGSSIPQAVGIKISSTNVALSSPPSSTNAGSDTALTFSSLVRHWCLQNKSSITIHYEMDATATTGSFEIPPGGQLWCDWPCTILHVLTSVAIPVNAANGLVIRGRAY